MKNKKILLLALLIPLGINKANVYAAIEQGVVTVNYVPGYGIELWKGYGANKVATGRKLEDGTAWKYSAVRHDQGSIWYQVANDLWISSDQGATPTESVVVNEGIARINYVPGYGIAVWNNYGGNRQLTGQKLQHGTSWRFFKKVIDSSGNSWYQVGARQWILGSYVKVTNTVFDLTAAKSWDPNYASLEVTKGSPIYSNSNFYSASKYRAKEGALVEVNSTILNGNTIWYELCDGGWLPSTVVRPISVNRSRLLLNDKNKKQVIDQVIAVAKQQIGKPYVWDGRGPDGFDCSGLMHYSFEQATGQNIGAWTVPQESAGVKVDLNQLQSGDLLFWGAPGATYHVGLYVGNNQYLHAHRPGTRIKIDQITSSFAPSFGVRVFP